MYEEYFKKTKNAIQGLWNDKATILGDIPYETDYGVTKFEKDKVIAKEEPCMVSYSTLESSKDSNTIDTTKQVIKLFIRPDLDIPTGSRITVLRHGKTLEFKNVGLPAIYTNHQEIILESGVTHV